MKDLKVFLNSLARLHLKFFFCSCCFFFIRKQIALHPPLIKHNPLSQYCILLQSKSNQPRGENQKGASDIFGEMEIYTSNESS